VRAEYITELNLVKTGGVPEVNIYLSRP
ncbi:uncharacterized protein METZ01_LOCUS191402, partial [marine metagenome]